MTLIGEPGVCDTRFRRKKRHFRDDNATKPPERFLAFAKTQSRSPPSVSENRLPSMAQNAKNPVISRVAASGRAVTPSRYSHGGVPRRSILTNVRPHLGQSFVFTTDVSDFFPNIHQQRVFDLFCRLGCSPQVASLCTGLCTYRHCLAQGLITSPILADHLMCAVDRRIEGIRYKHDLIYTRFMDDLAISGPFDLKRSGIPSLVQRICGRMASR